MILAFACSLLTLGPGQAPAPIAVPAALAEQSVSMLVQTSATHFAAENLGGRHQLILVGDPGFGPQTSLSLTPGQRVEHVLPPKANGALWIEVLERDTARWHASGAIALEAIGDGAQSNSVWIESSDQGLVLWTATPAGHVELGQRRGRMATGGLQSLAAPHVPGAPPASKGGDTPPKVPEKTLPPF